MAAWQNVLKIWDDIELRNTKKILPSTKAIFLKMLIKHLSLVLGWGTRLTNLVYQGSYGS